MSYYRKPKVTLPATHSDKDSKWLEEQLLKIHPRHRTVACVGYSDAYREGFNSTDIEHKKENAARKVANTRMRKFVDKCNSNTYAQPPQKSYNQKEYKAPENESKFSIDSL